MCSGSVTFRDSVSAFGSPFGSSVSIVSFSVSCGAVLGTVSTIGGADVSSMVLVAVVVASSVTCAVVGSVAVIVGSVARSLLSVRIGSFSFSVGSTAVTGCIVSSGVYVTLLADSP